MVRHGDRSVPAETREELQTLDAQLERGWSTRPHPSWSPVTASAPSPPRSCWSPPATTPTGSTTKAHLCGVAPLDATSGRRQDRHRLNVGGDRLANAALHMIALSRLRAEKRTQTYIAKKTAEGKSNREIMRCLKRYIAREVFSLLVLNPEVRAA